MSKSTLTRTWVVLHVVATVALVVGLDRLLVDLDVRAVTRALVVVAAGLAWAALGAMGALLATAVRDGMALGRRLRGVVADLADRQANLVRSLRDLRRELTDVRTALTDLDDAGTDAGTRAMEAHDATTVAVTGLGADLGERVDRLEGGLEQLGRDLARGLRAQADRLDDLALRRRGSIPEADAPE